MKPNFWLKGIVVLTSTLRSLLPSLVGLICFSSLEERRRKSNNKNNGE
jgi:hypothetical protein